MNLDPRWKGSSLVKLKIRLPVVWIVQQTTKFAPEMGIYIWEFPKIVVPENGWFIMESPIKMDDLGVPLFLETPI